MSSRLQEKKHRLLCHKDSGVELLTMSQRLQIPIIRYHVTQTWVPSYKPQCHKGSGVALPAVS